MRSIPIIIIRIPLRNRSIRIRIRITLNQQRQNNVVVNQSLRGNGNLIIVRLVQSDRVATRSEELTTFRVVTTVAEARLEFAAVAVWVLEAVGGDVRTVCADVDVVGGTPGVGGGLAG